MRFVVTSGLVLFTLLVAACTSGEAASNPTPTAAGVGSSGTQPGSSNAPGSAPGTQNPEQTPTHTPASGPDAGDAFITFPAIDLADYVNGDDISEFVDQVGDEKPFPVALMDGQPELSREDAASLVAEYFADTRVVFFKEGLRDTSVQRIMDFCDNGVAINLFSGAGLVGRNDIAGRLRGWGVGHGEFSEWNTPFLTTLGADETISFIALGYDGVRGIPRFNPAGENTFTRIGSNPRDFVRVFDYQDCPDPLPILELPQQAWELLGVGEYIQFPDDLLYTSPQLERDELVSRFEDWFTNLVSFENLSGIPIVQYCADRRGVILSPYNPNFGRVFEWRITDSSHSWPNMITIEYDFRSGGFETLGGELFFLGPDGNNFRPIAAASNPECSVEEGIEYAESIRADFGL